MIDHKNLPHIELSATPEQLRQYAKEYFGKVISVRASPETVVDRFSDIYFEETGHRLANPEFEETVDKSGDDDSGGTSSDKSNKADKPKPTAATIIVHEDEKDPSPICGSVQYVAYRIKRNAEVRVSMPILESLQNAVKTIYDPETMIGKEVQAYPFSIVQYHFD